MSHRENIAVLRVGLLEPHTICIYVCPSAESLGMYVCVCLDVCIYVLYYCIMRGYVSVCVYICIYVRLTGLLFLFVRLYMYVSASLGMIV